MPKSLRRLTFLALLLTFLCYSPLHLEARQPEDAGKASGLSLYQTLRRFELSGSQAQVDNLALQRDRMRMTFSGRFFFEAPVAGSVRGAVFVGRGTFRAEVPPGGFEQENVRRLLKDDAVESDFTSAVLRFTDDTFDLIGKGAAAGSVDPAAQKLAQELDPRLLKETGANPSSRMALSILNREEPGVFLAQFEGGKRDRFAGLFDPQGRIPVTHFGVNGGEKGLIFSYRKEIFGNDIWLAFYSLSDYQEGMVQYSDVFDLVAIPHYTMRLDLREPKKWLKLSAQMNLVAAQDGLRAIPMTVNEGLGEANNERLKKALGLKSARLSDGTAIEAVQEPWEGGLTLFLPTPRARGENFTVAMEMEGDAIYNTDYIPDGHYPLSDSTWYPRHGYLKRSTFDLTFLHDKRHRIAAIGTRVREEDAPESKSDKITQFRTEIPFTLATFGMGRFESHKDTVQWKDGGKLPIEFFSLPGRVIPIKEDFIVAELNNCVRYFSDLFGTYPYPTFSAAFHPFSYGIGYPTLLRIPATDKASKYTYAFIAHETAHQWWGNVVSWRSYRDQWLSEGFAEYSGILYTRLRDKSGSERSLIINLRDSLSGPPRTLTGVGKGRVADIGPLILGHRLHTRESSGAYTDLIYGKGALVLRMLHLLFTDPGTGNGQPFFDMMADFVRRHKNGWATTESFMSVAGEHFAATPLARQFGLKDLDWFFKQWVFESHLPSYQLDYTLEGQPDGTTMVRGTLRQDNAGENWFMPLPLVFSFGKDRVARGTIAAVGPKTPVQIKLPMRPEDVKLDPDLWVLSEKTGSRLTK